MFMALGCCWKIESLLVQASEFVHHGSDNPFLSTSGRNICYFDEKLIEWGKYIYIYINENTNASHQSESFDVSLGTKWLQLYRDAGGNPDKSRGGSSSLPPAPVCADPHQTWQQLVCEHGSKCTWVKAYPSGLNMNYILFIIHYLQLQSLTSVPVLKDLSTQ